MKKILTASAAALILFGAAALPAFADDGSKATSTTPAINTACVQSAVAKRETAVGAAFDAFSTAYKAALTARAAALNTAWGQTNRSDIRTGVNAAWKAFRTSLQSARKAHNSAVRAAWNQFRTDRKACGKNAGVEEDAGQGTELAL